MKNTNRLVILAGAALLLASAGQSQAQYQAQGDDAIAASPKLRQRLDERRAASAAAVIATQAAPLPGALDDGIAASPKLRHTLNDRKATAPSTASGSLVAGYKPFGDDEIAASPKLRQRLDEQKAAFEIAPLK